MEKKKSKKTYGFLAGMNGDYEMPTPTEDKHHLMFRIGESYQAVERLKENNYKQNYKIKNNEVYLKPHGIFYIDFGLSAAYPEGYCFKFDYCMKTGIRLIEPLIVRGKENTRLKCSLVNVTDHTIKFSLNEFLVVGAFYKWKNDSPKKISNKYSVYSGFTMTDFLNLMEELNGNKEENQSSL